MSSIPLGFEVESAPVTTEPPAKMELSGRTSALAVPGLKLAGTDCVSKSFRTWEKPNSATPSEALRADSQAAAREFRRRSVTDQRRIEKARMAHTMVKSRLTARAEPRAESERKVFFMVGKIGRIYQPRGETVKL